jgi:beta-lactamase class A
MKVPVMAAVWREIAAGRLKETDIYVLDEADRATGSGPLQFKPAGSEYTVEELLMYLGKNSDNTAWIMFNRRLGKEPVREIMTEAGMADSSYSDVVTTAADTARLFEFIYNGRAGGSRSREAIFSYLTGSIYEDRIPAGITGTNCEVAAHKVGTDAGVWADAGVLEIQGRAFVVVILNQDINRNKASLMVPDLVRRICEFEENRP